MKIQQQSNQSFRKSNAQIQQQKLYDQNLALQEIQNYLETQRLFLGITIDEKTKQYINKYGEQIYSPNDDPNIQN